MSDQRSGTPSARLAQVVLVLLAAAGGVAGIAWAKGLIGFTGPEARFPTAEPREPATALGEPAAARQAAGATEVAQPPNATHAAQPAAVARYVVCGREEAPARLFELSAPATRGRGAALWAVSCGATTHLIAIEAEQGVVLARRVARMRLPSPAQDRAPRPAPISWLASDSSWLVATLRIDRNGSPAGGALFRVPLDPGAGLGAFSRLHDASPGALAVAELDRSAGSDFAVLQLGDPRVAQAAELWLFSGGPAPLRIARRAVEPEAYAIAPFDLEEDGLAELAVLSRGASGRVTVHAVSDKQPTLSAATAESDGLYALDLSGDGKRVLVTSGPVARAISPSGSGSETQLAVTLVPALDGLRDLTELDTDADGRAEIVGYAHPRVIAVAAGGEHERSPLFELTGEGVAVLQARPLHLDGDGRLDLIALIATDGSDPQVELVVAKHPPAPEKGAVLVRIPETALELRNAPFLRELELR